MSLQGTSVGAGEAGSFCRQIIPAGQTFPMHFSAMTLSTLLHYIGQREGDGLCIRQQGLEPAHLQPGVVKVGTRVALANRAGCRAQVQAVRRWCRRVAQVETCPPFEEKAVCHANDAHVGCDQVLYRCVRHATFARAWWLPPARVAGASHFLLALHCGFNGAGSRT